MNISYDRPLHFFAVFTAVSVFLLIVAGGLVTSTGSGLAVPDWPLSYGQLMPPMVGGIFYEHGHRMVATFVGILTVVLAVWLWRSEQRQWVRNLGFVAVGVVVTQGLLGGLTVLFLLPTPISVSHATLAQTYFCIVASIALFTSRGWQTSKPLLKGMDENSPLIRLLVVTTAGAFVQLVLGAVMRHTQSGLAVPDFPLAYGQLVPSLSPESLDVYNRQLIYSDIRLAADGGITSSQIVIHMLHRYWAVIVSLMIVMSSIRLWRMSSVIKRFSHLAMSMVALLSVQVSLGIWTVLSRKEFDITTAHVSTGALLLAVCVLTTLHVYRLSGMQVHFPAILSGREVAA